ncbi:MAG: hypothetical protein ACSLEX_02745 [Minisyncoccota bacterium]
MNQYLRLTSRDILSNSVLLLIITFSIFGWHAFLLMMITPDLTDIWQPLIGFLSAIACFLLGTALWKMWWQRLLGSLALFIPSLIFFHTWIFFGILMVSVLIAFWNATDVQREFQDRLSFSFFRSVRVGSQFLFIAMSLAISGGYFVMVQDASWEQMIARFRVGEAMTKVIFRTTAIINPQFSALTESDTTVDDFLLSIDQQAETPKDAPLTWQQNIERRVFLQSGRDQVSRLIGRPVRGDEKIAGVLSTAMEHKLIGAIDEDRMSHFPLQIIPLFFTFLLFLTLLSVSTFFSLACIGIAQVLFWLVCYFDWLRFTMETISQKRLAP